MIAGPDGWWLTPEAAAWHRDERVAVVADVHLGYEWARAAGGDCVPAHSLAETTDRLARLLARGPVDRLVVAGDLVESSTPCPRTSADVRRLRDWLARRGVELVALRGNHDPRHVALPETIEVSGWTIAHGHRPVEAERTITGHLHPILRADAIGAPCFLVRPSAIVLPAFSPNAAGLNVLTAAQPGWDDACWRCLAGTGAELLDFGSLARLRERAAEPGERGRPTRRARRRMA